MGILKDDIKVRAGLYMRVSTEDQALKKTSET